jgi:hypothetical protein
MQPPSSWVSPKAAWPTTEQWSHTVLGDHNFREAIGPLAWWYRHTAPPDPAPGTSFAVRDRVRRGRIASAIMLFLGAILVLVAPIGLLGSNKQILYTALTVWAVIAVCLVLNRRGKVNLVGVLICLSVNVGMYVSILRAPGGLSLDDKDILYLLVFAELFIGAMLPVNWVFVPALVNIAFSILELFVAPHTPQLAAILPASRATILFRIIQLHVLVTGVVWILGTHARQAIARADRAEELARLQHALSQLQETRLQEGQRLQTTIETMIATLTRQAQGDLAARVPSMEGETLWPLVGTLNNLLTRYQRARQAEQALEQAQALMQHARQIEQQFKRMHDLETPFAEAVERAVQEHLPLFLPAPPPPLAAFFQPLQGKYLSVRSPRMSSSSISSHEMRPTSTYGEQES